MEAPKTDTGARYGMVVDLDRCNGCGACVVACAVENNVPPADEKANERNGISWLRVQRVEAPGEARAAFVPLMCQQCGDKTPCASVCPQNAVETDPESGIVAQVPVRCLGCRYCMVACPYHARSFNWWDPDWPGRLTETLNPAVSTRTRGVVEKCTFCSHRLQEARQRAGGRGRGREDAGRVHAGVRRGLPRGGHHLRQPRRRGRGGAARPGAGLLPAAGVPAHGSEGLLPHPARLGAPPGRRPRGDHRREDPWMNDSSRAASPAPPSAASCCGSCPGRRSSRSGSTPPSSAWPSA